MFFYAFPDIPLNFANHNFTLTHTGYQKDKYNIHSGWFELFEGSRWWHNFWHVFTYGAYVRDWHTLIDKVDSAISRFDTASILQKVAALVAGGAAVAVLTKYAPKVLALATVIAPYVGIGLDLTILLIGGAKEKIEKQMRGHSKDEYYTFPWRVTQQYYAFFFGTQNSHIYLYTPMAAFI